MSEPAQPEINCDIVMKGGITGGIVYPCAVTKLSERFEKSLKANKHAACIHVYAINLPTRLPEDPFLSFVALQPHPGKNIPLATANYKSHYSVTNRNDLRRN